jgi:capsular exopolysaccharide synthesis family protein
MYSNTTDFINDRISAISEELDEVEKDGEEYKTEYDFSDVFLNERSLYDRTLVNEKKLIESEIQLELVKFLREYIDEHPGNEELLPVNLGFEDVSIVEAVKGYNKLLLEKMSVLANASKENPKYIKLENELSNIKMSLSSSIENSITSLELEVARLEKLDGELSSNISSLPKHKRVLRSIERQQLVKEQLYLYLLQKREENEIASSVTEGNSKVIEPAYSTGAPVSPSKKMYYAVALFFGLFIPFSTIYTIHLLDNKVRRKEDIEKYELPYLASIPKIDKEDKIVIAESSNSPEAEAFRILRTNTNFIFQNSDKSQVIGVTSTIGKEGKSFIAVNLGTSFALTGKKTVVVELDLRMPKLMKYSGVSGSQGVTNFILDNALSIDQLVVPSSNSDNLYLLPCGMTPPNPAELIMRPQLGELIEKLKQQFDVVIIDTAPVGLVTDTLLMTKYFDACLYVVRANYLEKKLLNIPQNLYEKGQLPNMGVILNSARNDTDGAYGYGYGYGPVSTKRKWYKRIFKRT